MGQRLKHEYEAKKNILEEIMNNCINNKNSWGQMIKYLEPYKRQKINMLNLPRSLKIDNRKMFQ